MEDRSMKIPDWSILGRFSHGYLGGRVDAELQLCLLAVVHGQTLHQEGGEARAGAAAEGMEDQETLEKKSYNVQHAAGCRRKPFLMQLHQQAKSTHFSTTAVTFNTILISFVIEF